MRTDTDGSAGGAAYAPVCAILPLCLHVDVGDCMCAAVAGGGGDGAQGTVSKRTENQYAAFASPCTSSPLGVCVYLSVCERACVYMLAARCSLALSLCVCVAGGA
jgi:hypothetical protein